MKAYFGFLLCVLVFLLYSCQDDRNVTKLQYMPDMADGPIAKYHRSYLDPPEGSMAYNAMIYSTSVEEAEKIRQNPYRNDPNKEGHIEKGKKLYGTFCTPCHGTQGKGNGTIVDKYPRPANLVHEDYRNKGDGFFFYRITFGSELMPSYGHAISIHERWQIIMYIRTLQESVDHESK